MPAGPEENPRGPVHLPSVAGGGLFGAVLRVFAPRHPSGPAVRLTRVG